MDGARGTAAVIGCGLALLMAAACTTSVRGDAEADLGTATATKLPATSSPAPSKAPEDVFAGADPCSLLGSSGPGQLHVQKHGRDDHYQPTCVYQTADTNYRLYVELVEQADLVGNPKGIGKLTDTTVAATPAKIRRHPSNTSCTVALEAGRPTVPLFAVSTIVGGQDNACKLARAAAALAVPVIRDGTFGKDTEGIGTAGKDPCKLLTAAQTSALHLTKFDADDRNCLYHYPDGNQLQTSWSFLAAEADPGTGKLTDTSIGGHQAEEKRQPNNTFCTYVLQPEHPEVATVGVGGPPKFAQDDNCPLARAAAEMVSNNLY